jgi:hypothetical protein
MQRKTRRQGDGGTKEIASAPATPVGGLKLKPAAKYLGGLSVPTMHRLIDRGLLRPCRQIRHLIFPIKELNRFLEDGLK